MCSVSVFSNAFSNACFVSPLFGFAYVIRSPTVRGLALIVVAAIFDFADMMKHMIDRLAPEPAIAAIARVDDQFRGLAHPLFAVDRGADRIGGWIAHNAAAVGFGALAFERWASAELLAEKNLAEIA